MYCRNCAKQLDDRAIACVGCGLPPLAGKKYCQNCGHETGEVAAVCLACGVALGKGGVGQPAGADKRLAAGILAILLGALGFHKFFLGYKKEGMIMLLVTVLTAGVGAFVMWPIGVAEGVIYLTKSDEDFVETYVRNKKGWF
jgi:TM2 domain-containing membrane protein YozV